MKSRNLFKQRAHIARRMSAPPQETVDEIMAECGHYCCWCRKETAYEIHHIDGNHENHEKDNLMPLCSNCQKKAHTIIPIARRFTPGSLKRIRDRWYKIYNLGLTAAQVTPESEDLQLKVTELNNELVNPNE